MRGVEVIRLNAIGYLAVTGSLFSKVSVVIGPEKPKDVSVKYKYQETKYNGLVFKLQLAVLFRELKF